MKRTKIVSTIALLTVGVSSFLPVAANAETTPEDKATQNTNTQINQSDETTDIVVPTSETEKNTSETHESKPTEETESFSGAKLIVRTSQKTTVIDLKEANKLSQIAENYGVNLSDYRNSKGEALDPDYVVAEGDELLLFKREVSATSEVIELSIPTIEEESDEIYVGEKKVKTEGKAGKALKTLVETNDLSANKEVNKNAEETSAPASEVNSLTVIVKPEAKVILVGTKPIPEPTPEPAVENTESAEPESTEDNVETSPQSEETSSNDPDRDPISGEPLNNNLSSSSNGSGYATPNGASVPASTANPSSIVSSNGERGQKAVDLAYTRLGSEYVWAASGERSFDCSGLIYWIYNQNLGVDIPRTAKQQGSSAQPVPISQLQPGDLLWTDSHIGLYIGDGKMIHASRSNNKVVVSGIGWFLDDGAKGARIA